MAGTGIRIRSSGDSPHGDRPARSRLTTIKTLETLVENDESAVGRLRVRVELSRVRAVIADAVRERRRGCRFRFELARRASVSGVGGQAHAGSLRLLDQGGYRRRQHGVRAARI